MLRRAFIGFMGLSLFGRATAKMKIHFIRHASFILETADLKLLVDPMLGAKGSMDPVKISRNNNRIPLVDLPWTDTRLEEELRHVDAIVVTHTHRDHWDERARQLLRKNMPLICQPSDVDTFSSQGFTDIRPVDSTLPFKNLNIHRTGGRHGTGEIGKKMGPVSGFILESPDTSKVYIAGDTIWCDEVQHALSTFRPDFIVLNTGAARFDEGDPITMTAADVVRVGVAASSSKIVAVHMEAVNHCDLRRAALWQQIVENNLTKQCRIPGDGEVVELKF